jgi:hypothetical protein
MSWTIYRDDNPTRRRHYYSPGVSRYVNGDLVQEWMPDPYDSLRSPNEIEMRRLSLRVSKRIGVQCSIENFSSRHLSGLSEYSHLGGHA